MIMALSSPLLYHWQLKMIFEEQCIRNVLVDLAGFVSKQNFTKHHKHYVPDLNWQDNLGLDSIQIMELAAHVNSLFHIFETNKENYLLEDDFVDNWVQKVISARSEKNKQLTFTTSGTSGNPCTATHDMEFLMREVAVIATFFNNANQIVTYVPAYSIYGFLFTVLLPGYLNIRVVHASEIQWSQLSSTAILVATPFHWPLILPALKKSDTRTSFGVSATAMLTPTLNDMIVDKGVDLLEVYGATETSGIGYRKGTSAFQLFPYLSFKHYNDKITVIDSDNNIHLPLQDELTIQEDNYFSINNRKDNKVNIAGNLVDLLDVERSISKIDNIKNCTISAKMVEYNTQLSISIYLNEDSEALRALAIASIKQQLPAHKTPSYYYFEERD